MSLQMASDESPQHRLKPLVTREAIAARVRGLATEIGASYASGQQEWVILGLLNGALFFLTDFLRALPMPVPFECWRVRSYPGKSLHSSGHLEGLDGALGEFSGRHVLVLDDILDTGLTLGMVRDRLLQRGALSVRICVLLEKQCPRQGPVEADWAGFVIPNRFVVGYGLDYDGRFREVPDICELELVPGECVEGRG